MSLKLRYVSGFICLCVKWIQTACMHKVVKSKRSELDLVAGYPEQWIVAYQRTLFTFGSNQQSSADIRNTWIQRFCVGEHQTDHRTDFWTEWTN